MAGASMAPKAAADSGTTAGGDHVDAPELRYFVFALFFIFGGITSLNDVILPKLKELFTLNYTQAMLVQFCFFTAYLVIGIPGAQLVKKIGYMRGAVAGLLIMMAGCLLFIPASRSATYGLFLLALFVLGSGIVVVQVVANPLISLLGPSRTVHSRLTFAQAFNSFGTTIFPIVGSALILGGLAAVNKDALSGAALDAYRSAETNTIVHTYLGLAIALAVIAGAVFLFRNRLSSDANAMEGSALVSPTRYLLGLAVIAVGVYIAMTGRTIWGLAIMLLAVAVWLFDNGLVRRPRFGIGALCIFLYVGAEVSIGSLIVNYLKQPHVLGLTDGQAGGMIFYYWGLAMLGRFVGSALLRVLSPGKILAGVACGAIALILLSANSGGHVSAYSLLAIGLMNSIMFPTIFSLACEGLGKKAADGSGIINVAIFGGAVVPLLTGVLADTSGSLSFALLLPALCYAVIAGYGIYARRPAQAQVA